MNWQLCFYYGGTAVLTDSEGLVVWSSPDDEEFEEEFGDIAEVEDADAILDFLEDAGHLPEGEECDVTESDGGVPVSDDDDDDDDDDEDDDDEDC